MSVSWRSPAPPAKPERSRLRGLHRLAWYRLTRRWPRYRWSWGWDGGRPCDAGEMKEALRLVTSWRRKGETAPEPDYSRRTP